MNNDNELYYCCGLDKNSAGEISAVFSVKVIRRPETLEWCGCEILPPMKIDELDGYSFQNITINKTAQGVELCDSLTMSRLPAVHVGEDKLVHLTLKPFEGKYHRLNPKKLWPSKTALLRTITVLGETVTKSRKYITYWMTNRRIQMLDENHTEYGYFVCDYNGAISYLTFEQMQSIGNRYGFTNAKINIDRVTALDGSLLPQFAKPVDRRSASNADKVRYADGDESVSEFDIGIVRCYADTFFTVRRQQLSFDERSPSKDLEEELSRLTNSVEAFHQALIWNTVPKQEYKRICDETALLFSDDNELGVDYERLKSDILSRLSNYYFTPTPAFNTMLEKCGTNMKRAVNLHTLSALSKDILDRYSAIVLAEQEITQQLVNLSGEFDYKLFGLDFRIKSPDSLYEKLYERTNDTNKSLETLFEETRDILRYTVCFDNDEDYCRNVSALLKSVMDRYSCQLECFRNYWTPYVSGEYKGINATVRLPNMCWDMREKTLRDSSYIGSRYCVTVPSFCFEIQFHTQTSLEVKERNHKLYEKCRRNDISDEERQQAFAEMKKNIGSIVMPDGAEYLNMMSNEYIYALQDSIQLMQRELSEICGRGDPYVNISGINS